LEFSEDSLTWRSLPPWADFLMRLGYQCANGLAVPRRIIVVSMPVDSPGAGLVALGAIRRRMEDAGANDIEEHYQTLVYRVKARDSTRVCRRGFRGSFVLECIDGNGDIWARRSKPRSLVVANSTSDSRDMAITINRRTASQWNLKGEPPFSTSVGEILPNYGLYLNLISGARPVEQSNLHTTDSTICLAGRSMGEHATLESLCAVSFRHDGIEANLSQLLGLNSRQSGTVSRTLFYNSRIGKFDRTPHTTRFVIADGDVPFLRVLDNNAFSASTVIAVLHRTIDRSNLEAIGGKLADLRQWYRPYTMALAQVQNMPAGLAILALSDHAGV